MLKKNYFKTSHKSIVSSQNLYTISFILLLSVFRLHSQENFFVDWADGKVYSSTRVNIPVTHNFAHDRIEGLEYAKELARVNYYRALGNIRLSDSGENLYEYFEKLGDRKSMLFTLLDNAKLHKLEYPNTGTIQVTYFINIYGNSDSLLNIIMGGTRHYTEELIPYMGYNYENNYTGIIIDARGELTSFDRKKVNVKPSIFLTVKDTQGNVVFNRYNILKDVILKEGMVRYSYNIKEDIPSRVGTNPLRIVAYGTGDQFGSVLVVSTKDARMMLSSSASRNAIKNGRIIVVIDK